MRVVVTADDLGYSAIRDAGILAAARSGSITCASLLVNGMSAAAAARAARGASPPLPLGLHLNLTEGLPILPPAAVPSLLHPDSGLLRGKLGFRAALAAGAVDLREVAAEAAAQFARFLALSGSAPAHADGHQHVHVLPGVDAAFAAAAAAAGVRWVRLPVLHEAEAAALLLQLRGAAGDAAAAAARVDFYRSVSLDAARAAPVFARAGLRTSRAFGGFAVGGRAGGCSAAAIASLCAAVGGGDGGIDLELMFHPGHAVPRHTPVSEAGCGQPEGADDFAASADREAELATLCSEELKLKLAALRVQLLPWPAGSDEGGVRG